MKKIKKLITIFLMVLFLHFCSLNNDNTNNNTVKEKLNTVLEKAISLGIPGVALYVKTPEYKTYMVVGVADKKTKKLLTKNHLFRIYSSSKTFMSVLTLIAHFEGRLNLNDVIVNYLSPEITSRIQYASQITIRQLLNHTSGIYDVGRDDEFDLAVLNNPYIEYSEEAIVSFIYDEQPYFKPGEGFEYSNTNFVLIGLILDKVYENEFNHHSEALREKILLPLNLFNTFYEDQENHENEIAHGYTDKDNKIVDVHDWQSEYGHAFGGLLSTSQDMGIFIEAIIENHDFPSPHMKDKFLELLLPANPSGSFGLTIENYGLGIMSHLDAIAGHRKVIQHSGGGNGYRSKMNYYPEEEVTICILVNTSTDDTATDVERLSIEIANVVF